MHDKKPDGFKQVAFESIFYFHNVQDWKNSLLWNINRFKKQEGWMPEKEMACRTRRELHLKPKCLVTTEEYLSATFGSNISYLLIYVFTRNQALLAWF